MNTPDEPAPRKPMPFLWVMAISLLLLALPVVVHETFQWTDRWQGFVNGLITALQLAFAVPFFLLPPVLLARFAYRDWKPGRFVRRGLIVLPILLLGWTVFNLVFHPVTPAERFERFTNLALPADAKNVRCYFSGGGLADRCDEYYFETTPEEIDRLVKELKLEKLSEPYQQEWLRLALPVEPLAWPGAVQYSGNENGEKFFSLITDGTKTRAYVVLSRI